MSLHSEIEIATYFVGDVAVEWTVTPSEGYLKQNKETHFVISYRPQNTGV